MYLPEDLEHYLVSLLIKTQQELHLLSQPVATDLLLALQNSQTQNNQKQIKLQYIGDRCLLLTGLFPERANKRLVTPQYYIDIGKTAYAVLNDVTCENEFDCISIYGELCDRFVDLTQILNCLRYRN